MSEIKALQPFEQRVITERDQLQERLEKLNEFICSERYNVLPARKKDQLLRQQQAMRNYLLVLEERIMDFTL